MYLGKRGILPEFEESHDAIVQQGMCCGLGMGTIEHALKCTDDIHQIGNDRVKIGEHLRG